MYYDKRTQSQQTVSAIVSELKILWPFYFGELIKKEKSCNFFKPFIKPGGEETFYYLSPYLIMIHLKSCQTCENLIETLLAKFAITIIKQCDYQFKQNGDCINSENAFFDDDKENIDLVKNVNEDIDSTIALKIYSIITDNNYRLPLPS